MSDERTARLALPLLHAGQAQKELDHNEALALLDLAAQPVVAAIGENVPPTDPSTTDRWIVGPAPVGAWAGHAHELAGWGPGGWRFIAPVGGMTVWRVSDGIQARYDGAGWITGEVRGTAILVDGTQVVSAQAPPVATPSGGSTIDAEARSAVDGILAALRAHGLIAS
jgi:hypothetical protein